MKNTKIAVFFRELGEFAVYTVHIIKLFPRIVKHRNSISTQIVSIGINTLPIMLIISFFTGAIASIQLGAAMNHLIDNSAFLISGGVVLSLVREMVPVFTALVIVSRISSSITAEIGAMVVTEQIDALRVLSIDPQEYIALPRIFTGILVMPIVGSISLVVGVLGGALTMWGIHGVSFYSFFNSGMQILILRFYFEAIAKIIIFAFSLLLIATFFGFRTTGGSVGIGATTVKAVVTGTLTTIILDYALGSIFLTL